MQEWSFDTKLIKEHLSRFINFLSNDHECNILFKYYCFEQSFIALKAKLVSVENKVVVRKDVTRR